MTSDRPCAHLAAIATVRHAQRRECEECVKIGAQWVHLRTCQECGATLCCDSSPNRHASKHAPTSRMELRRYSIPTARCIRPTVKQEYRPAIVWTTYLEGDL